MAVRIVVGGGGSGGGTPAIEGSVTWEPSGSGAVVSPPITLTGAKLGDYIAVGAPYDLQGLVCSGYVTAANTAEISLYNPTGGDVTLGSGVWKVMVLSAAAGGGTQLGGALPSPLGTAAPGTSISASRQDHIHPMPTAVQVGAAPTVHTHTASQVTDLNEAVDDRVASLLTAGQNVSLSYDDAAGKLTINSTAGGGATLSNATPLALGTATAGTGMNASREDHRHAMPSVADIGAAPAVHTHTIANVTGLQGALDNKSDQGHTHIISNIANLQFTLDGKSALVHTHTANQITDLTESVQDVIGSTLVAGANVLLDYNDVSNTLTISTSSGANVGDAIPVALGAASAGVSLLASRQDHRHPLPTPADIGAVASSGLNELVDDRVGALLTAGSNISLTYNDAGNSLQISTSAAPVGTTLPLALGTAAVGTSLFAAREDHRHAMPSLADIGAAAAIHTHTSTEIASFAEAIDDRVAALITAGTGIAVTYNDAGNTLTIAASGAGAVPFSAASRFVGARSGDSAYTAMTAAEALAVLQPRATPAISAGGVTLNLGANREFAVTMNQSITSLSFTNVPVAGIACKVTLALIQDALGGRTVAWPGNVKFAGGVTPTLSGANKTDIIGLLTFDGGLTWFAVPVGLNF